MKPDQERIHAVLKDTITMLCRNGLDYCKELKVQGVIGVTVDDAEVFIVHVDETFALSNPKTVKRKWTNADLDDRAATMDFAARNKFSAKGPRSVENDHGRVRQRKDEETRPKRRDNVAASDSSPTTSIELETKVAEKSSNNAGSDSTLDEDALLCVLSDSNKEDDDALDVDARRDADTREVDICRGKDTCDVDARRGFDTCSVDDRRGVDTHDVDVCRVADTVDVDTYRIADTFDTDIHRVADTFDIMARRRRRGADTCSKSLDCDVKSMSDDDGNSMPIHVKDNDDDLAEAVPHFRGVEFANAGTSEVDEMELGIKTERGFTNVRHRDSRGMRSLATSSRYSSSVVSETYGHRSFDSANIKPEFLEDDEKLEESPEGVMNSLCKMMMSPNQAMISQRRSYANHSFNFASSRKSFEPIMAVAAVSPSGSSGGDRSGGWKMVSRYVCEVPGCNTSFSNKQNLLRHQTNKHGRQKIARQSRSSIGYLVDGGGGVHGLPNFMDDTL